MATPKEFIINVPRSRHHFKVVVHRSRAALRRHRWRGCKPQLEIDACCWQNNRLWEHGLVAELHFGADCLTIAAITHECSHAAWFRAACSGALPPQFEEAVATDCGWLVEQVVLLVRRHYRLRVH